MARKKNIRRSLRSPPPRTILNEFKPQVSNSISDEEALALLDEWIEYCERDGKAYLKSSARPGAPPAICEMAAELIDSIASLKRFRGAIQFPEQTRWALAMLRAALTASMWAKLTRGRDDYIRMATPRLRKLEKIIARQDWLRIRIEMLELTSKELLGSGNKPKRAELHNDYYNRFKASPRTMTADLKIIFSQLHVNE